MNLRTRAAAIALTVPLGLGLVGCGSDDPEPTAGETGSDPASTAPPTDAPPTTEPEPSPSEPTTSEPAPGTATVPVYFTGDSPLGVRLYREFRQVESDNPLEEAAALLLAGDALDPDYGTLLRGVRIESVSADDDAIVVTLAEDSVTTADKALSGDDARVAVQSLVYTLQGVAQARVPMRVMLADGSPVDLFDQPTGKGLKVAKQLDVLSLVNVTSPEEGATTSGTLSIEGVASSFEATVPFFVTDADGTEVLRNFTTADGWIDRLYPFTAEVDVSGLAPGGYTLHAETDDPTGGAEGPGPFADTKTFTID